MLNITKRLATMKATFSEYYTTVHNWTKTSAIDKTLSYLMSLQSEEIFESLSSS